MLYSYCTVLKRAEEEFWNTTPKTYYNQLKIHNKLNSNKEDSEIEYL